MADGKNEGFSKAFRKACDEYAEFNPGDETLKWRAQNIGFVPDLVFLQIQGDKMAGGDTVQVLAPILDSFRSQGAKVINWNGDIRYGLPPWMIKLAPHVDITAFSNQRDINSFHGTKAYLQIGIDPEIFNTTGPPMAGKEIVFFANHYGHFPLSQFRLDCARALRNKYGKRFGLYGGFPDADGDFNVKDGDVTHWQGQEAGIYRTCSIAISISHYQVERYTSDRILRSLGCGAFTLAHYYDRIWEEFPYVKVFRDVQDLLTGVDYYLMHESERKEIAKKSAEHLHQNHTYDHMVQNIFKLVK